MSYEILIHVHPIFWRRGFQQSQLMVHSHLMLKSMMLGNLTLKSLTLNVNIPYVAIQYIIYLFIET
jgi:hypothetical protein